MIVNATRSATFLGDSAFAGKLYEGARIVCIAANTFYA